jgi:DNA-binding CsgD family transcriptional regulator
MGPSTQPSAPGHRVAPAAADHPESCWRRLVTDLARHLQPLADDVEEEVLFATEADGVRYTLSRSPAVSATAGLSAREQEIARMVAKGYTNKTIAAVLEISTWTVDTHLRRVFTKLDVRCRSAMVARLFHLGNLDRADTPEWSAAWRAHVKRAS